MATLHVETLRPAALRERDFQAAFDQWFSGRDGWTVAGASDWLRTFAGRARRKAGRRADG